MNPAQYLQNVNLYGDSRLNPEAKEQLHSYLERENEIGNVAASIRNHAIRLVEQSKMNSLYARVARTAGFESTLSEEELNDSYKKALVALQTKDQRSYASSFDHISQLLQLGPSSRDNQPLVTETLDVIFDGIIPEQVLIERLIGAMRTKDLQRPAGGRSMEHRVLLHASNHLGNRIAELGLRREQFLDLLEVFVRENWRNADTYNRFIDGFGVGCEQFPPQQAARFISLLVQAGLNQVDILDEVINKTVTESDGIRRQDQKSRLILDLV